MSRDSYEISYYDRMQDISLIIVELTHCMPHLHREIELCYVLEGEGIAEYDKKRVSVRKGDYILFNMRKTHDFMSVGNKPVTILRLKIAQCFGDHFYADLNRIEFESPCIGRAADPQVSISDIILPMAKAYFGMEPQYQLLCIQKTCELIRKLMQNFKWRIMSEDEQSRQMRREQRTERILKFAEEHYTQKVNLSELAEMENLSLTYMSHFVRNQLGMSFQEYVELLRCKFAESLIDLNNDSLMNICMSSGFQDTRQMNKAFVKYVGITAAEYRSKLRNGDVIKNTNLIKVEHGYRQHILTNEGSVRLISGY